MTKDFDENKEGRIVTGYPSVDRPWMQFYDEELAKRETPKQNLTDYLKDKTKGLDYDIASSYYGVETTYDEFWENVDTSSKVLTDLGIKKYDRIMNLVPNIPESGEIWLGATQIGATSDFVDPRPDTMDANVNAKKVLELLRYEKAKHIIALDKCYLGMLRPIENEIKELGIDNIIILSASERMDIMGKISYLKDALAYNKLKNERERQNAIKLLKWYEVLMQRVRGMEEQEKAMKDAIKSSRLNVIPYSELVKNSKYSTFESVYEKDLINYIGHTSGTSGARPKPICLTNENQISATEQIFKAKANFQVGDKVLHILPFFSPLGADNNYVLNLASGSTNIEVPEFEINEFGYLLKKYKPNVILAPPSWLASLPKSKYLDKEDFSCITRIIYGGDSMTKEDEERINEWLLKHNSKAIVEKGHGMSEYCGCGSYAQKDYNKFESIGIPLPNTIYTLVNPEIDDHLEEIKFNGDEERIYGELAVSSEAVTNGMLDDDTVVKHYDLNGNSYIRTRDLAQMDRDGIFYFDSRKDRSFTRFDGYKVKPYEIEKEIEKSSLVKYCRIVPYYSEEKRGLMPKAHIVLNFDYTQEDLQEITNTIIAECIINNPNMVSRQIPTKIKYRDNLPLTKNSKVDFNALINEGLDGEEVSIIVEETNLTVGNIEIVVPKTEQKLTLKK